MQLPDSGISTQPPAQTPGGDVVNAPFSGSHDLPTFGPFVATEQQGVRPTALASFPRRTTAAKAVKTRIFFMFPSVFGLRRSVAHHEHRPARRADTPDLLATKPKKPNFSDTPP